MENDRRQHCQSPARACSGVADDLDGKESNEAMTTFEPGDRVVIRVGKRPKIGTVVGQTSSCSETFPHTRVLVMVDGVGKKSYLHNALKVLKPVPPPTPEESSL